MLRVMLFAGLGLVATLALVGAADGSPQSPGGDDGLVLCRTRSGTVKARRVRGQRACRRNETQLDPAALGFCGPCSPGTPPACEGTAGTACPGEGTCVDGTCACLAIARCAEGLRWDPSPGVCACVPSAGD